MLSRHAKKNGAVSMPELIAMPHVCMAPSLNRMPSRIYAAMKPTCKNIKKGKRDSAFGMELGVIKTIQMDVEIQNRIQGRELALTTSTVATCDPP